MSGRCTVSVPASSMMVLRNTVLSAARNTALNAVLRAVLPAALMMGLVNVVQAQQNQAQQIPSQQTQVPPMQVKPTPPQTQQRPVAPSQPALPPQHMLSPQVVQQTRQLLDWLGLMALLEQAPSALALSVEAEAKFQQVPPANLRAVARELEPQLQPAQLQKALVQYVAERYQAATFKRAEELLQQPLAKRARFFDLAMTQANAVQGLKSYRAQLQASPETPPQAVRRGVIQELDAATATSLLTAILQTGVADRVRHNVDAAGAPASATTPAPASQEATSSAAAAGAKPATPSSDSPERNAASTLTQEFVERQRFLAPLTEDYLLYAYRYFKDDELVALRDLMRDAELQWLLDVSRQGLIAVLKGNDS